MGFGSNYLLEILLRKYSNDKFEYKYWIGGLKAL